MVWPSVLGQFFNKNDYTIQDCPDCRWCRVRFTCAIAALDWSTYASPLFTTLSYCWSGHRCPGSSTRYDSTAQEFSDCLWCRVCKTCLQCYSVVWSGHWCLGSFISIWLHHPGISWLPMVQSMQDLCFYKVILLFGPAIGAWAVSHKNMITPLGNFSDCLWCRVGSTYAIDALDWSVGTSNFVCNVILLFDPAISAFITQHCLISWAMSNLSKYFTLCIILHNGRPLMPMWYNVIFPYVHVMDYEYFWHLCYITCPAFLSVIDTVVADVIGTVFFFQSYYISILAGNPFG